jgi:hypothetical protein
MKLRCVTVSGVGSEIAPQELIELSVQFPFVEFGIQLASESNRYWDRFPQSDWLNRLTETCSGKGFKFSGHLCGKYVKDILLKGLFPRFNVHPEFEGLFQRWQLNTHGSYHHINFNLFPELLVDLEQRGQAFIFQLDGPNDENIEHCAALGFGNVEALYDESHGSGSLPDDGWTSPLNCPTGYSGGLSPDNLEQQLELISEVVGPDRTDIWIDAESKLRTSDGRLFDLEKARSFLEVAKRYVV